MDDLLGQPANSPNLLGDRDEDIRTDDPAQRMLPAGEYLEADDLAGGQLHLRFEERHELLLFEAVTDALLDLRMDEQGPLHGVVEPDRSANATICRVIGGNIRAA